MIILRFLRLGVFGIFLVVLGFWALSGIYIVEDSENAVVLTFGKHVKTVEEPGVNWHIPSPIQTVWKEDVMQPKRLEYGYRTVKQGDSREKAEYKSVQEESLMLTGDENLVHVETSMQFIITDIEKFYFNVDDPFQTLRMAGETTVRRVIANHPLDDALTDNKMAIQQEIEVQVQELADKYGLGIRIKNVQLQDVSPPLAVDQAFKSVAAAKEKKQQLINESQTYANEVLPKARGNASEAINEAEAYKEKRMAEARGDVAKFIEILKRYQMGKEVTRTRMYLETMEEVLPNIEKYIVDESGNTVQFLPLGNDKVVPANNN